MIEQSKRRLDQAKRDGADRIYGWQLERRSLGPAVYVLKVVDGTGRCYFQRELFERPYLEAVKHWMSLGTPNQTMRPEDEATRPDRVAEVLEGLIA